MFDASWREGSERMVGPASEMKRNRYAAHWRHIPSSPSTGRPMNDAPVRKSLTRQMTSESAAFSYDARDCGATTRRRSFDHRGTDSRNPKPASASHAGMTCCSRDATDIEVIAG